VTYHRVIKKKKVVMLVYSVKSYCVLKMSENKEEIRNILKLFITKLFITKKGRMQLRFNYICLYIFIYILIWKIFTRRLFAI